MILDRMGGVIIFQLRQRLPPHPLPPHRLRGTSVIKKHTYYEK